MHSGKHVRMGEKANKKDVKINSIVPTKSKLYELIAFSSINHVSDIK